MLTLNNLQGVSSLSVRVMDWDLASKNDVVGEVVVPGTHFTCFTSTKVQILTPEELRRMMWLANKVAAWYTVYLLYEYKKVQILTPEELRARRQADFTLLALLVQKYRY